MEVYVNGLRVDFVQLSSTSFRLTLPYDIDSADIFKVYGIPFASGNLYGGSGSGTPTPSPSPAGANTLSEPSIVGDATSGAYSNYTLTNAIANSGNPDSEFQFDMVIVDGVIQSWNITGYGPSFTEFSNAYLIFAPDYSYHIQFDTIYA